MSGMWSWTPKALPSPAIVIRGRYRLFGLLGREEDTVIPWEDIQVIGEDTILVRCPAIKKSARRRKR